MPPDEGGFLIYLGFAYRSQRQPPTTQVVKSKDKI